MEDYKDLSAWKILYNRLKKEQYLLIPGLLALLNGYWHRIKFQLACKDVKIGSAFRVYGKMIIRGPGKVRIGSNFYVDGLTNNHVCLSVGVPGALIEFGDNCGLNGTVLQCSKHIRVGDWSNIADAYITDTPAHALSKNRRQLGSIDISGVPIEIKQNVWVSTKVVILHGVTIGENSVIAACSLIRKDVPANVMVAGNPQNVLKKIED
jgi:acetyltransferase-like isoleucine patch superfamily enzyme